MPETETPNSSPHSQLPTKCHNSEPDQSSSRPPPSLLEELSQYYPSFYVYVFQVVSFHQVSTPKPYMHFSHSYVSHDPPISFLLIWSPEKYMMRRTHHKSPFYVVFITSLLSYPHKTTGKFTVLYILVFMFLDSKLENKRFCTWWQMAFPDFNLLLIFAWMACDSDSIIK